MSGSSVNLSEAESFSGFYARTYLVVFRYVFGIHAGAASEIEDLTAETFMRAWKARKNFTGNEKDALRWVLRIARNLVIDTHRRQSLRGTQQSFEEHQDYLPSKAADTIPEAALLAKEQEENLLATLQRLPGDQREMIVLRYILGWQVKEIAAYLEMAENTVSVYLRRGLKRMRDEWPG